MYEDKKKRKELCSNARNRKSIILDEHGGPVDFRRCNSIMDIQGTVATNIPLCENWYENDGSIFDDDNVDNTDNCSNPYNFDWQ